MALRHESPESISVGSWGPVDWSQEWLYYIGRSRWGWTSRAKRFADSSRNKHWHIDYFEASEHAEIRVIFPVDLNPARECDLARYLLDDSELEPAEKGLGASDCGPGCQGHVLTGKNNPQSIFSVLSDSELVPEGGVVFRENRCLWVPPGEWNDNTRTPV